MQGPSEVRRRGRSPSPARPGSAAKGEGARGAKAAAKGVVAELKPDKLSAGEEFLHCVIAPLALLIPCPVLCMVLSFITCSPSVATPTLSGAYAYIAKHGAPKFLYDAFAFCGMGSKEAWVFLLVFNFLALLVYWWPGPVKYGPLTPTGHKPEYMDNGIAHCALSTLMFFGGHALGWYDLGIIYDVFAPTIGALNAFGLLFCGFLYVKGMRAPSTADSGSSGHGFIFDYYWGAELYPRLCGVDVKKFVNCRFSMTFWALAGISFTYRCGADGATRRRARCACCSAGRSAVRARAVPSEAKLPGPSSRGARLPTPRAGPTRCTASSTRRSSTRRSRSSSTSSNSSSGRWATCARSTSSSTGCVCPAHASPRRPPSRRRSRPRGASPPCPCRPDHPRRFGPQAGFYETWGCLVWVPCVYTLHTRILVRSPSNLSWPAASAIFAVGLAGVLLNFWADSQRMYFREKEGKCTIWGQPPKFIKASYEALNQQTGKVETHQSLLLACGWWGVARHFQYLFELTAAWSWGILGAGTSNGALPLFYAAFLTILLFDRAKRDEKKCLKKYGEYYKQYMQIVQYKIIPYVY